MILYNTAVQAILANNPSNRIVYWDSYVRTDEQIDDTADGLHVGPETRNTDIQILLNYLCNPHRTANISKFEAFGSTQNCCCCV